ncbi:MAG TPA: SH3 domain-containing protein [Beijerinckiaceae bacterium]|nr:SH3 domain-containing protein [Beijerinckiaceae bacterium]
MKRPVARLAGAAMAVVAMTPGLASTFCPIPNTRDGFVALRAGPDLKAPIVARMRQGDEIQAMSEQSGPWIRARYWRGDERLTRGFGRHRATGWVHRSLVADLCG